jgi:hypothetical protein
VVDIKYDTSHHAGANAEARIKSRLKPSSPGGGQEQAQTNPTRCVTTITYGGTQQKGNRDNG